MTPTDERWLDRVRADHPSGRLAGRCATCDWAPSPCLPELLVALADDLRAEVAELRAALGGRWEVAS
jgi:hypothetical protein